jgi:hypothetical protein
MTIDAAFARLNPAHAKRPRTATAGWRRRASALLVITGAGTARQYAAPWLLPAARRPARATAALTFTRRAALGKRAGQRVVAEATRRKPGATLPSRCALLVRNLPRDGNRLTPATRSASIHRSASWTAATRPT